MVTFENPWSLLVLVGLIPLFVVFRRSDARARQVLDLLHERAPAKGFQPLRFVLVAAFVCSLAVVAARPFTTPPVTGDFIFLIDTSRSMQASNFCGEPTFLDRARNIVFRILDDIPEGRFGIMTFDRLAFPVSPMTYDHAYLREVVRDAVFVGMTYEATRTNLANALQVVGRKKHELPGIYGNVSHAILVSDGYIDDEDWRQSVAKATYELRQTDTRVVAIAIGNNEATPIHHRTAEGECQEELIEIDERVIRIPRVRDTLMKVAEDTQGGLFDEQQTDEAVEYLRAYGLTDTPAAGTIWYEDQRRYRGRMFLAIATAALLLLLVWERRSP